MSNFQRLLTTLVFLLSALLIARELDYHQRRSRYQPPLTVYVTGEIANPGTATLPLGSRRIHALAACGGVTPLADLSGFEPARPLVDGETVEVSRTGPPPIAQKSVHHGELEREGSAQVQRSVQPSEPSSEPLPPGGRIGLNSATVQDLQQLPGIGPVLAERIVQARDSRPGGSFTSIEDLSTIRGIKRKTLGRLEPYLELEGL